MLYRAGRHRAELLTMAVSLDGHDRTLPLLRLEQADRSAVEDHVHRIARLGASVMISESWYQSSYR